MSRFLYSVIGVAGLGTAGWLCWQVADELLYQSKMRPLLDEAVRKVEASSRARRLLGPPPYKIHGGGRSSVRPMFRQVGHPAGREGLLDEAVFWIEGRTMARVTAIGERHKEVTLKYVGLEANAHDPIVVYNSFGYKRPGSSILGMLSSLIYSRNKE